MSFEPTRPEGQTPLCPWLAIPPPGPQPQSGTPIRNNTRTHGLIKLGLTRQVSEQPFFMKSSGLNSILTKFQHFWNKMGLVSYIKHV